MTTTAPLHRMARLTILSGLLILSACKKEKPAGPTASPPPNEEELITTVKAIFVHAVTGDTAVASWVDLDGDGGNAPVISGALLQPGATYAMHLLLLNQSVSPADTISNEVVAEAEAHQFFFSTTGSALQWQNYGDADANGLPLGLLTGWTTSTPGAGDLTIILRHQPNKGAAGVSAGSITNAGGETDIAVTLPYVVQ